MNSKRRTLRLRFGKRAFSHAGPAFGTLYHLRYVILRTQLRLGYYAFEMYAYDNIVYVRPLT